ncbi:MAG: response regulator [bacterium]|nr:response regulator [bacterium]
MADTAQSLDGLEPKKILLAQYDPQDRRFARFFLDLIGGYQVLEAATGMDVIKLLKHKPDLIVLDTAAQGNFLRALEIIRRNKVLKNIPVAIYSNEQKRLPECIKRGADGFIVKPSPPAAFLGKVWKLLGSESQKTATAVGFANKYKRDLQEIDNLPTLPTVYAEVDRLCKNPDVSSEELSKVIETDPSISLKLLSLANSAFFGFSRQIKSVHDAISLLGNKTVQNTILNIAVFEATKGLDGSKGFDKNAFWLHSAGVGSAARELSKKLKIDREEAFTAGIVHDMGKIILDALYTDFYEEVIQKVKGGGISIFAAEEEIIGLHHGQIGKELCESWDLPTELTEAVSYHHRPKSSEKDTEIASLVNLGDHLARKFGVGSGGDDLVPEPAPGALQRLNVTVEQLDEWESDIQKAIDRDQSILSTLKG